MHQCITVNTMCTFYSRCTKKVIFFSHCHTTIPGSIWSWEGGSTIFNLKADHWRNTHIFPYETCHNLGLDQPESVVICDLYRKLAPLGCFHPGLSKFAKKVLPFGLPWPAVPAPPKSVPCHFHMLRVCHKTGHEANMKLYWWFRGKNTRKQYPYLTSRRKVCVETCQVTGLDTGRNDMLWLGIFQSRSVHDGHLLTPSTVPQETQKFWDCCCPTGHSIIQNLEGVIRQLKFLNSC